MSISGQPRFSATSIGEITLPIDLDILRPSASTVKPCVSTCRYGASPVMAQQIPLVSMAPATDGSEVYSLNLQVLLAMTLLAVLPALLVSAAAAGPPVIDHRVEARFDVAAHRVEVTDFIVVPPGVPELRLDGALEPVYFYTYERIRTAYEQRLAGIYRSEDRGETRPPQIAALAAEPGSEPTDRRPPRCPEPIVQYFFAGADYRC